MSLLAVDTTTFLRDALVGAPLERIVPPPPSLDTGPTIWRTGEPRMWIVGDWQLIFPNHTPRPAPDLQHMVARIREWTMWSARKLAEAIGTSHTTVYGIESGRRVVEGHSGDLRRRITDAYNVFERIFLLSGRDSSVMDRLLETAPPGRPSAMQELRSGAPNQAYLAALDVLRPRSPGMLTADRVRLTGATAELND